MLSSFAVVLEDNTIDDQAKTTRDEASLDEELAGQAQTNDGSGLEPAEEQSTVLESVEDLDEGKRCIASTARVRLADLFAKVPH